MKKIILCLVVLSSSFAADTYSVLSEYGFMKKGEVSYSENYTLDPIYTFAYGNIIYSNLEQTFKTIKTSRDKAREIVAEDLKNINSPDSNKLLACEDYNKNVVVNNALGNLKVESSFVFEGKLPKCKKKKCFFKSKKLYREYTCKTQIKSNNGGTLKIESYEMPAVPKNEAGLKYCDLIKSKLVNETTTPMHIMFKSTGMSYNNVPYYRCSVILITDISK